MGRITKMEKINRAEEGRIHVSPNGDIVPLKINNSYLHNTKTKHRQIRFDNKLIHNYRYNKAEGLIVPYNRSIADNMLESALVFKALHEVDRAGDYENYRKELNIERDENKRLKYISSNFHAAGGGQIIEDGRLEPSVGVLFNKVGGMRYTYGIELETTAGRLTYDDLVASNVSMEGDRTIMGYEYVTNILAGNSGLESLKRLASAISRRTIIGEKNGLHIHIGGIKGSSRVWMPAFNRMFSVNAIKLGVQIEDEMYSILHPPRRGDRYLKSIKEWGNINNSNWRDILGDFVFRGSDDIFRPYNRYETHTLDERHNTGFEISRWAKTKHKWLNLNHCNADSHVNTIEFRLYSATGSYNKIYNFLLLSLAIVWFIEHKQRLIWNGNITLYDIVQEAYDKRGYHKIAEGLHKFIINRTDKFKI